MGSPLGIGKAVPPASMTFASAKTATASRERNAASRCGTVQNRTLRSVGKLARRLRTPLSAVKYANPNPVTTTTNIPTIHFHIHPPKCLLYCLHYLHGASTPFYGQYHRCYRCTWVCYGSCSDFPPLATEPLIANIIALR